MDNLTEKLLADREGKPLPNMDAFDKTDKEAVELLVKNNNIFDQAATKYIQPLIVDSIMQWGLNTAQNKFLLFAANPKISNVVVPLDHGRMIYSELQSGDLILPAGLKNIPAASWLFDPRTYKGDIYKLQALLLLSDTEEASKFGDVDHRPFDEVLKATSRDEVEKILSKWQTKSGEETYSRGRGYGRRRGTSGKRVPKDKKDWIQQVVTLIKTTDLKSVEAAAAKAHKEGRSEEDAYAAFMQELAVGKESSAGGEADGAASKES